MDVPLNAPMNSMPPEKPLRMPVQDLRTAPAASVPRGAAPIRARLFVFGVAALLTAYGATEMYAVVSVKGTTALQWTLLALFTVNFSWIALAFASAILGFAVLLVRRDAPDAIHGRRGRTAMVMPVYNESTAKTLGALEAMRESLEATGRGDDFDWFLLSDSTSADAWVAEERAYLDLVDRLGPDCRVHYRHRVDNHHRKAGNVADFVRRWGGAYDHMLVLDADSVMTGECVVALVEAMESDPAAGIVQSVPMIVGGESLFARVQQFAGRIYGPVIAAGLAEWSGRDGNYWGHNAVIRTKAFADQCGLPDLPGRPPFGGHVLSHDFVEAALIRRAGWGVRMLPTLKGSYEGGPPSLLDVAVRDRRWAQGNLQHSRVIGAAGLALASRQHFATGIMSYLASPLWLAQLVVGVAIAVQVAYLRGSTDYFQDGYQLYPNWPRFDPVRSLRLFEITMGVLLAPKFLGWLLAVLDDKVRRGCGGGVRLTASTLVETLVSALVAPLGMVLQSWAVAQILAGRDGGWNPQRRDDGGIPWKDVALRHKWHTTLGVVAGASAWKIAPSLLLWMSPTVLGLALSAPISWVSGRSDVGRALRRVGILAIPEEKNPPAVVSRAAELEAANAGRGLDGADGIVEIASHERLRAMHLRGLGAGRVVPRGTACPDRETGRAKIEDAANAAEASSWMGPKERRAVLSDVALVESLGRLPA